MSNLPGRMGSLTAHDIMTPNVIVLRESQTIASALDELRSHHITGAPVVNADGRLVGILSLSDLVGITVPTSSTGTVSLAHGNDPTAWDLFERAQPVDATSSAGVVSSRMSLNVSSVDESAPLVEVARLMCDGHWHRVPVVDARGSLTGIISTMDVLAALVNAADELEEEQFA